MRALLVIVSSFALADACARTIPKDYVFKCAAPNGKGLQDVLETIQENIGELQGGLGPIPEELENYRYKLNRWLNETIVKSFADLYQEQDYKILIEYMCEKAFVDVEFYIETMIEFVRNIEIVSYNYPDVADDGYGEGYANLTAVIRNSDSAKNMTRLFDEAAKTDPYAQLGMERITSPTFQKLLQNVLSLAELKEFMQKIRDYNVRVEDVLYFYQTFTKVFWLRFSWQ